MKPNCNLGTIRSRLKRRGKTFRKLAPDLFLVHAAGQILTPVLSLTDLERYSWDQLHAEQISETSTTGDSRTPCGQDRQNPEGRQA